MTDETPDNVTTFEQAVMDMGKLFRNMQVQYKIPPAVTLDIIRLQMMFMTQSQNQGVRVPPTEPPEVRAAEANEAQDD